MITRKVGPALAAGCTVVIKPAQLTPLTTLAARGDLRELRRGLPTGVINVVTVDVGAQDRRAALADPRLRKLSFTGSTEVGQRCSSASADNSCGSRWSSAATRRSSCSTTPTSTPPSKARCIAKMRNTGQTCVAANRFLVHESVAEEFTAG